jgi:Secretion system C-terminal sorting domain
VGLQYRVTQTAIPSKVDVGIIPNPADEVVGILLNMEDKAGISYSLRNTLGIEVVRDTEVGTLDNWSISTVNLPTGIYFLTIKQSGKILSTHKLFILH